MKIIIREYIPSFVEIGDDEVPEIGFNSYGELHNFLKEKYPKSKISSNGFVIFSEDRYKSHIYTMIKGDVGELREEFEGLNNGSY